MKRVLALLCCLSCGGPPPAEWSPPSRPEMPPPPPLVPDGPDAGYVAAARSLPPSSTPSPEPCKKLVWDVRFSPRGKCQEMIVGLLDGAKSRIHVQAYSFTSVEIQAALSRAASRGVDVEVVLDKASNKSSDPKLKILRQSGAKVYIDAKHAIAHNKLILVDNEITQGGSYNYSKAAELSNAENCLWIRDPILTKAYEDNFTLHRNHSNPM